MRALCVLLSLAAEAREGLTESIIEAVEGGARPTVCVEMFGKPVRGKVLSATEEGLEVEVFGQAVFSPWSVLSPRRFLGLAASCVDTDSAEKLMLLARFAHGEGLKKEAGDLSAKAARLDARFAEEAAKMGAVEEKEPKGIPAWALGPEKKAKPKAVRRAPGKHAYVTLGMGGRRGLLVSRDRGLTRTRLTHSDFPREYLGYVHAFKPMFHPENPNIIYLSTWTHGLWVSTDSGKNWREFKKIPFLGTSRVTLDPDDDSVMYVTTYGGGVWKGPSLPE